MLLQAEDDGHGLVEDQELGLGLVALEVELHHAAQLLESLVDVTHTQALTCVVGHSPFLLPLGLLLRGQVLIVIIAARQRGGGMVGQRRGKTGFTDIISVVVAQIRAIFSTHMTAVGRTDICCARRVALPGWNCPYQTVGVS